jgi:hypothetical protein
MKLTLIAAIIGITFLGSIAIAVQGAQTRTTTISDSCAAVNP